MTPLPAPASIFVAPTSNSLIGVTMVESIGKQIGYKGEIAILSATPTSPNQNTWIKFMKVALKLPKYKNMKLVTTVYGNDDPTDSAKATQGLISAYPNLKGIISPTTVGVQAAAQELQQESKCGDDQADRARPSQRHAQVREGRLRRGLRALERVRPRATWRRTSRTTCSPES